MKSDPQIKRWLDKSRVEWDNKAEFFDEMSARNAAGADRQAELDLISEALQLRPGSRVLDAGCGPGYFAIAFAQRGCVVDGVDISPQMIERARANAAAAGVEIAFSTGDLAALDAPDATYDAIAARMVLQFSPHLSAVLDEFERVGKPDARFWLSAPGSLAPMYRDSWRRFIAPEPPPINFLMPWELIRLLDERGWQVHQQWGSFDSVAHAANNVAAELDMTELPLPMQQAAATVWNIIATRPSP